jgi:hypothetical protein
VLDLQLGEILLIAWVDIRSSDNAEGARKRVLNHIFAHFEDDPSVSYESISLRVEVIPRRREAIEATKAKQAKKDSNASD